MGGCMHVLAWEVCVGIWLIGCSRCYIYSFDRMQTHLLHTLPFACTSCTHAHMPVWEFAVRCSFLFSLICFLVGIVCTRHGGC